MKWLLLIITSIMFVGCTEMGPNKTAVLRECIHMCMPNADCIKSCGDAVNLECHK
jgi:hypothetical protein